MEKAPLQQIEHGEVPLAGGAPGESLDLGVLHDRLLDELRGLREACRDQPIGNPVQQLALRLARRIDAGDIGAADLARLVQSLAQASFVDRAAHLRAYLGETAPVANLQRLAELVRDVARADTGTRAFTDFRARLERAHGGLVLTAHPTFAQTEELTRALADLAVGRDTEAATALASSVPHRPPADLTLDVEHAWSIRALHHLHDALEAAHRTAFTAARELYPDDWTQLRPRLVTLASWVGYDHDGRTDITWLATLTKRLMLKREHLERLARRVTELIEGTQGQVSTTLQLLESVLTLAAKQVDDQLAAASFDPADAAAATPFDQRLQDSRAQALTDTGRLRTLLAQAMGQARDDALKIELGVLLASLVTHGLGLAHTHVRINATHLHNAVRLAVGLETHPTDPTRRRTYVNAINELIGKAKPQKVTFEILAGERSTARKVLMTTAKILQTIDGETRIRVLIAETESAFTLLSALYLSRLFGIEDNVELSPLFETQEALEHGERVIDEALKSPHFKAYVRRQGRLCVQFGYSDSGRYLGQMAATNGIERLRLKLAEVMERHQLAGVELVLFDTHGESVGRGGHPASVTDRLRYLHTPAAQAEFTRRGIPVKPESSYQGADGWAFFMNPEASLALLRGVLETLLVSSQEGSDDPVYQDADFAAEFFATTGAAFAGLVDDPNYAALLGAFHTNMLYRTGSRPVQRQHQGWTGPIDVTHPSQLRAIPNNAVLQQLGLLANTVYGVGKAARQNPETFHAMLAGSARFRRAMVLVNWARTASSADVLQSYLDVLDPGLWLTWSARDSDSAYGGRAKALRQVAGRLERGDLHARVTRVALALKGDHLDLCRAMTRAEKALPGLAPAQVDTLTLLHVVRVAMLMRLLLLATAIPEFSPEHGISQEQIFDRVAHLDIQGVVAELYEIFPRSRADRNGGAANAAGSELGYDREHEQIFQPMLLLHDLIRQAGVAIGYQIGAMG